MSALCARCRYNPCMCNPKAEMSSPHDWRDAVRHACAPPASQPHYSYAFYGMGSTSSMRLPSQPIPLKSPQHQPPQALQQHAVPQMDGRPVCPNERSGPASRCRERQCHYYHPNTSCKYFLQGMCRDADYCRYSHSASTARDVGGAERVTQPMQQQPRQHVQRANSCGPSMTSSASTKRQQAPLHPPPLPQAHSDGVASCASGGSARGYNETLVQAAAWAGGTRARDDSAVASVARVSGFVPTIAQRYVDSPSGGSRGHDTRSDPDVTLAGPNARNLTSPSPDYFRSALTSRGPTASGEAERSPDAQRQKLREAQYYQMLEYGVPGRVVPRPTEFVPSLDPERIAHCLERFSQSRNVRGLHAVRVCVMQQTYNFVKRREAEAKDSAADVFHKSHPLHPATSTRVVRLAELSPRVAEREWRYEPSLPIVMSRDCVEIATEMREQGLNPLMLNMASATSPGGGFLVGDGAQEENLHRRSNYYQATNSLEFDQRSSVRYPLPDDGGLYSPSITFFRGTEARGYPFLRDSASIACIAVAAIRHPQLSPEHRGFRYKGFAFPEDRQWMRRKIEVIYAAAVAFGHDALVLGAFGCGAFRCPAAEVAQLIASVHQLYGGYLKHAVVAILEDHNAVTDVNPDGLLYPFRDVFNEHKAMNEKKQI